MVQTIKIHSVVDVITNSSSVIYTFSGSAIKPLKELFTEIFKLLGEPQHVDDVFDIVAIPDGDVLYDHFINFVEDLDPEWPYYERYKKISEMSPSSRQDSELVNLFAEKYKRGIKEDWMDVGEDSGTELKIFVKDEKYNELANKAINFLYSTQHESIYN
jgi:hypothetical protein